MVTKLRNEITNFRQRPDESLFEAWERYKLSIDLCPNHNMLPVTQIDTFYNDLTLRHRDTINTAAGGTFMKMHLEECYDLIENMTAHHNDWVTSAQRSETSSSITSSSYTEITALEAEMAEINKNLMRVLQYSLFVYFWCMSTHSYVRNLFPPLDNPELTIRRRSRTDPTLLNDFEMAAKGNSDLPVLDLWTMKGLCQPSLNGRGGLIAPIAIQATNFGLKNDMIQQSIKVNGVTDDALRLYLFPHSLTHYATAWFDRLPRNSINTFEQMAKMFFGRFNLRRTSLIGFPTQSIRSFNAIALDLPYLLVLNTGASQSRQHGKE
nr:reverse transcriptase domain-containing protein [Tanacetum cinerariifolium]